VTRAALRETLDLGRGGQLAFAAALLYGVAIAAVAEVPAPAFAGLVAVSAAIFWLARRTDVIERIGFASAFAVQTVLFLAAMLLGHGVVSLHVMPIVSQSALVVRERTLAAICLGFAALHVAVGTYFFSATTAGIEVIGFLAACAFVVAFTRVVAAERRARAELTAAHATLAEYAAKVEDLATIQERNRVARDVHDSLGHYLTVVHVQAEAARTLLGEDPAAAAAALERIQRLARDGLDDVRRSVAALRAPPEQARPLPEAIAALVSELATSGTVANLRIAGEPRMLPAAVALALFRTAQEALTNIRRHAGASRADIELVYAPATVALTVADNGRGAAAAGMDRGYGLLGVRERLALVGGQVQIDARSGAGFTLRVEIPV